MSRTRTINLTFLLCFLSGLLIVSMTQDSVRAETVLWDRSDARIVERGFEIAGEDFTRERLIARCQEFLKTSNAIFAHLTLVHSGGKTPLFLQFSDIRYEAWLSYNKRALSSPMRVAEMTSIHGNAVLRVRDGLSIWRIVLSGKDPLMYHYSGTTFEILHLVQTSFTISPLRAYVRSSGRLRVENVNGFYAELLSLLATKVYVDIRKDPWFFEALTFPQSYFYDLTIPPDNFAAVANAPRVTCFDRGKDIPPCEGRVE
jgi:hypothetical protein